jgi:hypothetical protein
MRSSFKLGALAVAAILVGVLSVNSVVVSQEKQPDVPGAGAGAMSPEMQAEMEAWTKYATPGKQHQMLKDHFAGSWNTEVKMFHGGPEAPPETSTGTTVQEMILGGRYIEGKFTGTAMGQPFEGRGLTGFDNAKNRYFGTWIDTMGSGILITDGEYDESTKTYKFTGEMTMPTGQPTKIREEIKIESNDKHTFDMYMTGPDGREMRSMTITYTRKK